MTVHRDVDKSSSLIDSVGSTAVNMPDFIPATGLLHGDGGGRI